jgi:hypothetical protein
MDTSAKILLISRGGWDYLSKQFPSLRIIPILIPHCLNLISLILVRNNINMEHLK